MTIQQIAPEFTDLGGFRKAWDQVRDEIRDDNGLPTDARFRLRSGSIVMDMQVGGRWVLYTDDAATMRDRIRMGGGTYRLRQRRA